MLAEVFAGRIGSPLDPGISLFELDPSDGQLVFLAGNNNTLNPTQGTDGSIPLFTDSALTAGLTAGDYYLAVADGSNTPSPLEGQMPGSPGHLRSQPARQRPARLEHRPLRPQPPRPAGPESAPGRGLVAVQRPGPRPGPHADHRAILGADQHPAARLPGVRDIVPGDASPGLRRGDRRDEVLPAIPGLQPRDRTQATFQMLDGLPNGSYALHLSGPGGLTDLGGNPLVGNDPSGDYVIPFHGHGARPRHLGQHDRRLHDRRRRPARALPRTLGSCSPTSSRPA